MSGDFNKFKTINLLDGTTFQPPYITENGVDYYGSGYLLKKIADQTAGLHFETHLFNWDFIAAALNPNSVAPIENLDFGVIVDNGSGTTIEQREVNPNWNDGNKPVFIIGSTTGEESFEFQISAKIKGIDSTFSQQKNLPILPGSERSGEILPAMLALENLNDLFAQSGYDTAAIVKLAIRYNLLCDYTALIALEPNDTLHFMRNPFDESGLYTRLDVIETENDSLEFDVFPNPFNERVSINMNIPDPAALELVIFNLRGQIVKKIVSSEVIVGRRTFIWDSSDGFDNHVSSGLYFVRAKIRSIKMNKETIRIKRILLVR